MESRTVLEIDLKALASNVKLYKSYLHKNTKLCAVVKASGYGSSDIALAKFFEKNDVDYLAVAYTSEGVNLRESGISCPILVFNPEIDFFDDLIKYNLEPTFYDFSQFEKLKQFDASKFRIHIKLDSGMHRTGFDQHQIAELIDYLTAENKPEVISIFSHLAASEDKEMDRFTNNQIRLYTESYDRIQSKINNKPIRHILNSAGIIRFPNAQFEMVRLGIGMHSDDISKTIDLTPVHTLKTKIIQIKTVLPNEGIGYSMRYKRDYIRKIAIIPLGYADGIFRLLGNKNYKVWINGNKVPIVGNVSMDTCFVDITGIENINTGDTVEIFGKHVSLQECAIAAKTISYEVLSRISPRVERVYIV